MTDPRVENLAKILVEYSTDVQPGDWVLVHGHVLALPLVEEVVRQVIHRGGNPNVHLETEELTLAELEDANEEQLRWISPLDQVINEKVDVTISLRAASNTRALSNLPPEKEAIRRQARRPLFINTMKRSAEGKLRWTLTQYPCQAYAQDADMSLREYEDFVYGATFSDQPNPIEKWQQIHEMQQRLIERLKGKNQVVIRSPNCDLALSISGRNFINSDGKRNMPSGEIYTSPVEDSVNGVVRFTYPAINSGREVEGVELTFQEGKVVNASASKNEDFLLAMLDTDPGARYLGEFAIGTNYGIQRFTRSILFDEKIGGSFHMAVGAGFPEAGSKNESSIHWDFICDIRKDSEILVDGDVFYKDGQFQV
jgi:aminopeptidase